MPRLHDFSQELPHAPPEQQSAQRAEMGLGPDRRAHPLPRDRCAAAGVAA